MFRRLPLALLLLPELAGAQNALVGKPDTDWTAYRNDVEVWGWSSDYRQMACLGAETQRFPTGGQRGEAYMLIYEIGSLLPKENVHLHYIAQVDNFRDPPPLFDIRDNMWLIHWDFQNMWPRRPMKKRPAGGMVIEPLWDRTTTDSSTCSAAVGFMLTLSGQRRYQPHLELPFHASCALLRQTDTRVVWAKKDLGAVMIRFDYSPDDHEQSTRYALAAAWSLGKSLRIVLQAPDPGKLAKPLGRYGRVDVQRVSPTAGPPTVHYRAELATLAARIARELGLGVGAILPEDGPDLLIGVAPSPPTPAAPAVPRPVDPEKQRLEELDRALEANPNPLLQR